MLDYRHVIYPFDSEILNKGMHVWASVITRGHSERKEGGGSGERVPVLVYRRLNCVREVFSCMVSCILQTGADARGKGGDVG